MTSRLYAGVDLGGTKILALVCDGTGGIVGNVRVPTIAHEGPDAVIDRIVRAIGEAAAEAGAMPSDIASIGIAAPGPIDFEAGMITDPPNLPGWHNVPLAARIRERIGVPARLENDANAGAVGEHRYGAGRGYRHLVYVTASTGVGGGLIIDDTLYTGASGAAGEIGHVGVAAAGPACGAGHPGCLEAYASGAGIAARAQEAIDAGRMARLARMAEREPPLTAEAVYLAAQQGESEAAAIIEAAGRYFGVGLASIINTLNPQAIVIGGGLVNMGEAYLGPALEVARTRSFPQSFEDVRIVEWELGEMGTALGAMRIAQDCAAAGTI